MKKLIYLIVLSLFSLQLMAQCSAEPTNRIIYIDSHNSINPIELNMEFSLDESMVYLTWQEEYITKDSYYSIERSTDAIHYEVIEYVNVYAKLDNGSVYTCIDMPEEGQSYFYRVVRYQKNSDGVVEARYSNIEVLSLEFIPKATFVFDKEYGGF